MDVLSEVLHSVRMTGAIYFDVRPRAPWVAETPPVTSICARVMPEFEYVIPFHFMLEGSCWAYSRNESEETVRMRPGDVILFPQGDGHAFASEPGQWAKPDLEIYRRPTDRRIPFVLEEIGGQGEPARFVCGYIGCDARPFNPIISALPRVLHIKAKNDDPDAPVELIRIAVQETSELREGSETVLAKLSELMFVQALRRYIDSLPSDAKGWLAGLRDAKVGKALTLIHGRPAEDWTLDWLARQVHMSRSAFAERFSDYVGEPPIRYLMRWRMQLALKLLDSPRVSIGQAAERVGYKSEPAFNRAFKKHMGKPPGEWRRSQTG